MTQADRVLSTPPTNTSAVSAVSAPGAIQFSPQSLIPASPPDAYQETGSRKEPVSSDPTCKPRARASINRRSLTNMMVSAATLTVTVPASTALAQGPDDELVALAARMIELLPAYEDAAKRVDQLGQE
jgi:hypothetical protein